MTSKKLVARSDYLLPQSLEGLHIQSREWLDTIAFWKDETRFFSHLLQKREAEINDPLNFPKILGDLDTLHETLFDYLADEIRDHERLLSRVEGGAPGLSDSDYREQHRQLAGKMEVFSADFREFKRMVFGYARKW
ncbi:hypothetical protein [Robiginitalea sp. SC105]|uniref:hypothetical protein n=1 Tax=Robiginitalea sp. SC105 TaxID=2762332 RepID=UPI00163A5E8D|nr:hypothetical protein [Robiginitalea sp. SC105]MBC2839562.1 hypothetical protein [Robiginitalea sp. SC105]